MAFSVEFVFNSLNIRSLSRPHGRRSWGAGSEHQLRGVGSAVSSTAGFRAESRSTNGFHVF